MPDESSLEWPSVRSTLHRLQCVSGPPQGWVAAVDHHRDNALDELVENAAEGYRAAFPDSELLEFDVRGASYLFDVADDRAAGRSPRVVAAWGRSVAPHGPRDRSRQAGFPLPADLLGLGYERGHLLAHATGGGLDENLFAQASHVNQGRSPAGRFYRRLERLAASHPGCLIFHRLIYGDGTDVPDLTQLTVGLAAALHTGTFDNRPQAWVSATGRLVRGQGFHRNVQTAFLAGLVAADAHPERTLALSSGRRRVDLLVLPRMDGEVMAVVVEIKSTDWDALRGERVRPNVRRHLRQLQDYLDHYVDHLRTDDPGDDTAVDGRGALGWDSVVGVLLYPKQPSDLARARLVEEVAGTEAITVVWYDQAAWHASPGQPSPPSMDS